MVTSHERLLTLAGLLAAAIVAVSLSVKIHLPLEFSRPCRSFPQAEWILLKTGPDTFEARFVERDTGERQSFELYRFERGDLIQFDLSPSIRAGATIGAGEEVAHLRSRMNQQTRETLQLELLEAGAGLQAIETGEKPEIVAQARAQVSAAEAMLVQRESEFRRARSLLGSGLMSRAGYELVESSFRQAQAELTVAQNQFRSAEVGEKEAIVAVYRARIELLRRQIHQAEARMEAETLRSPLAGRVVILQADSALVRIADTDTLYALAPVPPSRAVHLRPGDRASIQPASSEEGFLVGWVVSVDSQASVSNGRTFFWVTVAVPNPEGVSPGLIGKLCFSGERVTLLAWVVDRIRHTADRTLGA
ncbi:MAG: hypothetical protein KAY32_06095 [Candidatus Eisenbacteria sp.]|nr:hypothetical protein [Candidatus Eisenbacteria bacterium]